MTMRSGSGVPPISGQPNPIGTVNPINPYEGLIEQFLRNVELTGAGVQRGFENLREERMVEEDRQFTEARDTTQHARQVERDEWGRENELTDQANTMRGYWSDRAAAVMPYISPIHDAELYNNLLALTQGLTSPMTERGMDALNRAMAGQVTLPDGSTLLARDLLAVADRKAEVVKAQDQVQDRLYEESVNFITAVGEDSGARLAYVNAVVLPEGSPYNDDQKRQLLAIAGISDPRAIDRYIREKRADDQAFAIGEQTIQRNAFELHRDRAMFREWKDFAGMRYEEFQNVVAASRQELALNDLEAFMATGYVPKDEEERAALAAGLGMTVDKLEKRGLGIYNRVQRMNVMAEENARLANQYSQSQIKAVDIANAQNQILLDRDRVFGEFNTRAGVLTNIAAAANLGDVNLVREMMMLARSGAYGEQISGIDFESFITRAEGVFEDEEDIRWHAAEQRDILLSNNSLVNENNLNEYLSSAASTFLLSDFTVSADGTRPVEAEIREWVENISAAQLRRMTGAAPGADYAALVNELTEKILNDSVRQRVMADRTEAGAVLEALIKSPPAPGNRVALNAWMAAMLDNGVAAGLKESDVEAMAQGILDGSDAEFNKTWSSNALNYQQADYYFQETYASWLANRQLEEALLNPMHILSAEEYADMQDMWKVAADSARDMVTAPGACNMPNTEVQWSGTGDHPVNFVPEAQNGQCGAAWDRWVEANTMVQELASATILPNGSRQVNMAVMGGHAPSAGGPGVSAPALPSRLSVPVLDGQGNQMRNEAGEPLMEDLGTTERALGLMRGMEAVDQVGYDSLMTDMQYEILVAVAQGATEDDINTLISEGLLFQIIGDGRIPVPTGGAPIADIVGSTQTVEWFNRPVEERASLLGQTSEWLRFVTDVVNSPSGMVEGMDPREQVQAAARFGFMVPGSVSAEPSTIYMQRPGQPLTDAAGYEQMPELGMELARPHYEVASPRPQVAVPAGTARAEFYRPDPDQLQQAVAQTVREVFVPHFIGEPRAPEAATSAPVGSGASPFTGGPRPATSTGSGLGEGQGIPTGRPAATPEPSGPPSPIESLSSGPQVFEMVRGEEGFRAQAYQDSGGVWTVGYGQTGPNVGPDTVVTREQAEQMLAQHVAGVETEIKRSVKVPLTQNQYDALVSLVYNIGEGAFRRSNVLKHINSGNLVAAANAFLEHHEGGGQDNLLLPRRQRERALFLSSVATAGR